jgi:hypothetical protein
MSSDATVDRAINATRKNPLADELRKLAEEHIQHE